MVCVHWRQTHSWPLTTFTFQTFPWIFGHTCELVSNRRDQGFISFFRKPATVATVHPRPTTSWSVTFLLTMKHSVSFWLTKLINKTIIKRLLQDKWLFYSPDKSILENNTLYNVYCPLRLQRIWISSSERDKKECRESPLEHNINTVHHLLGLEELEWVKHFLNLRGTL